MFLDSNRSGACSGVAAWRNGENCHNDAWKFSQLNQVRLLASMGSSPSLGLGGRPSRPIGSLGTSKLYRVAGKTVLCYPIIFSASDFYLYHDMALLTEDIREELRFINKHWRLLGRPTFAILISENDMRDPQVNVINIYLVLRII